MNQSRPQKLGTENTRKHLAWEGSGLRRLNWKESRARGLQPAESHPLTHELEISREDKQQRRQRCTQRVETVSPERGKNRLEVAKTRQRREFLFALPVYFELCLYVYVCIYIYIYT